MQIVKGDLPQLTPQQRELVRIFVEHLRSLPVLDPDATWNTDGLSPINQLLFQYFKRRYSYLPGGAAAWDTLSAADAEKYRDLMQNAASPADPRIKRRLDLLGVARSKRSAQQFIEYYQRDRRELGLPPDNSIGATREPVGLERATVATWGNQGA